MTTNDLIITGFCVLVVLMALNLWIVLRQIKGANPAESLRLLIDQIEGKISIIKRIIQNGVINMTNKHLSNYASKDKEPKSGNQMSRKTNAKRERSASESDSLLSKD